MTRGKSYIEASVPVGVLFVALGLGTWLLHSLASVFTGWAWAALIGSVWVALGALFLFSDIRVYQFDRSPVERLLLENDV